MPGKPINTVVPFYARRAKLRRDRPAPSPAAATPRPASVLPAFAERIGVEMMLERIMPPCRPPANRDPGDPFWIAASMLLFGGLMFALVGWSFAQWWPMSLGLLAMAAGIACVVFAVRAGAHAVDSYGNYLRSYERTQLLARRLIEGTASAERGETEEQLIRAIAALRMGSAAPEPQWLIGVGVSFPIN